MPSSGFDSALEAAGRRGLKSSGAADLKGIRDDPIGHTITVRARPKRWFPFMTARRYDKTCRCVEAEWMADQLRGMAVEHGQSAADVQILCVRDHRG